MSPIQTSPTGIGQLYHVDAGSDLYRVDPDGSVAQVLSNGSGTDVQYVGRVQE